ncbi:MAG: hypothetical protein GXP05_03745 [Alphaproteobacteria bacterium]|nr:hypothetical protein [Alphaproteobacteria bacterium]
MASIASIGGLQTLPASTITLAVLLVAAATYQLSHPKTLLLRTAPATQRVFVKGKSHVR